MHLNGYDPGSFDDIFSSQPDTQLNAWASEPGSALAHYGASYMFLRYLMDHYGGRTSLADCSSKAAWVLTLSTPR